MANGSIAFLVVEDVEPLRRGVLRALAPHGHVEGVGTLAEGLRLLRGRRFDSLIVDVQLPDGDGLDLIAHARQLWSSIWILVLTGSAEHALVSRVHELGVRYLLKPFSAQQLKIHADEARARRDAGDRRVSAALDRWTRGHNLTEVESALLALGARGVPREEFSMIRGVRPDTVRKQIQALLHKTGDVTFEAAVNSLLREALSDPF